MAFFLNTGKLPSGVMQIILFDSILNPLSERLVFCLNQDRALASLSLDRENYKSRQQIKAAVNISDTSGRPLEGSFSVSVTDDVGTSQDTAMSILTTLLLTSELKGIIRFPEYYFSPGNPDAALALDLLMMTNGWRRYNIPDVVKGEYEKPAVPMIAGMEISGKVKSLVFGKPVSDATVSVLSWGADYYDDVRTGPEGAFSFNRLEYADSTEFIIQAHNKKGYDYVELLLDDEHFPHNPGILSEPSERHETGPGESTYALIPAVKMTNRNSGYFIENGMRMIYLDEIVVEAKREGKASSGFSYYPDILKRGINYFTAEDIKQFRPLNLADLLRYIPYSRESCNIPLVVNNIVITDYDLYTTIEPSKIDNIAILRGLEGSSLGAMFSKGAIVITLKRGAYGPNDKDKYNIKTISPLGYQKPAEFYSPRYDNPGQKDGEIPDLRTTIYWNPDIRLSSAGEAFFDFFSADVSTTYTMVIEGLSVDGTIIRLTKKISRK
jgi:hypothetical protein